MRHHNYSGKQEYHAYRRARTRAALKELLPVVLTWVVILGIAAVFRWKHIG